MGKGKKEKDSRDKYTKTLIEKSKVVTDISMSGYNFEVENGLQQQESKVGITEESGTLNKEFKLIAHFLVLMLYQIYRYL
jgi:hypothetical protein